MVSSCNENLGNLFRHTCSALSQVQRLVKLPFMSLSDSIMISAVYLSIGPFFVVEPEPGTGGGSSEGAKASAKGRSAMNAVGGPATMKGLRLPALNLLRNIFAKHSDQRQWIIEEILTSLIKLPDMKKTRRQFGLGNGQSIHSVTALLLQLVQTATHGLRERITVSKVKPVEDDVETQSQATVDTTVEDAPAYDLQAWQSSLDAANQSAKAIAVYLMQR